MEYLDSYYSRDYIKEINELKKSLGSKGILLNECRETYKINEKRIKELIAERDEIKLDLDHCELEILGIDEEIKKPEWLIGKMLYKPRRRFVSKTMDVTLPFEKPQHCFDKAVILYDLLKKNELYKIPKTYDNMKKVMKLITGMMTYEQDKTDNWRPISDCLIFKHIDCDDSGGIAITSAIGMAGWNDDETFCCVGWYYPKGKSVEPNNKFCHAWNITKCNGKFYVLEGTDRRASPRLWEDWKDKYVCNLGVANWKFEGVIKNGKTYI